MSNTPNNLGDATLTYTSQTDRPVLVAQELTTDPAPTTTPVTAPIPSPPIKKSVEQVTQGSVSSNTMRLPQTIQTQAINRTSFVTGDTVRSVVDGRIGTIVTPDALVAQQIGPTLVLLPSVIPILPSATPAAPLTNRVKVNWSDGTSSIVLLSTLRRA